MQPGGGIANRLQLQLARFGFQMSWETRQILENVLLDNAVLETRFTNLVQSQF